MRERRQWKDFNLSPEALSKIDRGESFVWQFVGEDSGYCSYGIRTRQERLHGKGTPWSRGCSLSLEPSDGYGVEKIAGVIGGRLSHDRQTVS